MMMFVRSGLAKTVLLLFVGIATPWCPLISQADPGSVVSGEKEASEDLLSDGVRLLRIEAVIERDQESLSLTRAELERRISAFKRLGADATRLTGELEERQQELDSLIDTADADARSVLEDEIQELEEIVDLYKAQAEIDFITESGLRRQVQILEKKIAREQRAVADLRGVEAVGPSERVSTSEAPLPTQVVDPMSSLYASTAQIEAQREVDQQLDAVRRAEGAVLEFVKRRESLKDLIDVEGLLLETAQRSGKNLGRVKEFAEQRLESRIAAGADPEDLEEMRSFAVAAQQRIDATSLEIEDRNSYLGSLEERLEKLEREERTVLLQRERIRDEARAARTRLTWLESPIHPSNLLDWVRTRGPRILAILAVAVLVLVVLRLTVRRIARLTIRRRRGERTLTTNRADTLALSVRSVLTAIIILAAIVLVFEQAGVDITTLLGGAAILGLAVAFGAQNLMRDYFTGLLILLEDQYELGDLVTIGTITGTVEMVNMRTTVMRDLEGRVHFIPNGEVKSVTNWTYVWGRAVLKIPVGYRENVDRVIAVITEIVKEFQTDPEFGSWVIDEPVVLGVDKFIEEGVVISFMVKTPPEKMFAARRELLRRVKNRFDQEGIEIFVPRRRMIGDLEPPGESASPE